MKILQKGERTQNLKKWKSIVSGKNENPHNVHIALSLNVLPSVVTYYTLAIIWERWTMQLLLNASYIMDNNDFELLKFWWAAAISLIEFSRICVDGVSGTGNILIS